jgi:HSP20 family protein
MFKYYEDIIRQMERELERLSGDIFQQGEVRGVANNFWQPRADVCETADRIWVKVEISGVRPEQIKVSLSPDQRMLTITGVRDEESIEIGDRVRCYQLEVLYGPFERVVHLPSNVPIEPDVSASYKDGFLVIVIPKRKPEGPRTIPIE